MIRLALTLVLAGAAARAEIIDRVAVTLDNRVITESEILREMRLAAFVEGAKPDSSGGARRKTAERLAERALMRREMQISRYPLPAPQEADALLAEFRKARFAEDAAFREALARYGIREGELRDFLLAQLTVLRFIDFRFKPSVQVLETEIKEYYDKRFLPQSRAKGVAPDPAPEAVHDSIEKLLIDEKVDRVLDNWMKDARTRTRIVFHEKVFQ